MIKVSEVRKMGQFNVDIPDEVHKKLKIRAVEKEKTMEALVLDLIKKEVKA